MRRESSRLPALGAAMLAAALTVTGIPAAGHATDGQPEASLTREVEIAVSLDDGSTAKPLPGTRVSVSGFDGDTGELVEVAAGVAGQDGLAAVSVTGPDTSYIVDAVWPGAQGDLESVSSRSEFRLSSDEPVNVRLWGPIGTVSGTITATMKGAPVTSLAGAKLALVSGGVDLQTLDVAADGTFASAAVPTSSDADYSVRFVPPPGTTLADAQPANDAFALPRISGGVSEHSVERAFELVSTATTPDPEPGGEAPNLLLPPGVLGGTVFSGPGTPAQLGGALGDMSEEALAALLSATQNAAGDGVVIANANGQVLGLALGVTGPQQQLANGILSPTIAAFLRPTEPNVDLLSLDLETALLAVQSQGSSVLNRELADQIILVQQRNAQLGLFAAAANAVRAFIATPNDEAYTAAAATTRDAGVAHAFLDAPAAERPEQAEALLTHLKALTDSSANSQQMDMLRIQSLSGKRNEAFDAMSDFAKKMQGARSSIIGNMRSTPVALGSVEWDRGVVTGAFDLAGVEPGDHHLIMHVAGIGYTTISSLALADDSAVEGSGESEKPGAVEPPAPKQTIAETGGSAHVAGWVSGGALLLLGAAAIAVSLRLRRVHPARQAPIG